MLREGDWSDEGYLIRGLNPLNQKIFLKPFKPLWMGYPEPDISGSKTEKKIICNFFPQRAYIHILHCKLFGLPLIIEFLLNKFSFPSHVHTILYSAGSEGKGVKAKTLKKCEKAGDSLTRTILSF